jgi:DNA polymerase III alpha subunit (gram-positive type)|tara:strand:- start:63 stop:839 length:777 start_codon:yes stop_codon:yes gene_type:complete
MNTENTFVILDIETTGLKIPDARIIKVNLLKYNTDKTIEKMTELINPGIHISEEITEINGISNDDVAGMPHFAELADKFEEFIDGGLLVGYNIKAFDLPMFVQEFYIAGKQLDISAGVIDLREIYMDKEPRTLIGAYKHYMEKLFQYTQDSHSAKAPLSDRETMLEIFKAQMIVYKNMPDSLLELSDRYKDSTMLDLARRFRKDSNTNQVYFSFGKFNGKTIQYVEENDPSYISWILGSALFPGDTKEILRKYSDVKE